VREFVLGAYIVLPLMAPALITCIVCTLIALFALGVAKGRIVRQAWQRAGRQVMLIGSASAAVGFCDRSPRDRRHRLIPNDYE
jgi:VIT1/CCC1 family predicted Fe2+/Mn2+ transporter